jgi:hypothetical protein
MSTNNGYGVVEAVQAGLLTSMAGSALGNSWISEPGNVPINEPVLLPVDIAYE